MPTTSLKDVFYKGFVPMERSGGCLICGTQLSFHQQIAGRLCDRWQCTNALLEQELRAHRREAAAAIGELQPESYPMVVVPDDPVHIDRLPQSRKQAHINFLYDLSVKAVDAGEVDGQAAAATDPNGPNSPASMALRVCGVCRGNCCRLGKAHAYLDAADISCFSARSRITNPLEIVYAYSVYLPVMSVVDSCVYQTGCGCALPRRMRAGICTAYRCKGLDQAEQLIRQKGSERLFVAVRRDNRISRSAFIRRHSIHHYPLPDPVCANSLPLTIANKENLSCHGP